MCRLSGLALSIPPLVPLEVCQVSYGQNPQECLVFLLLPPPPRGCLSCVCLPIARLKQAPLPALCHPPPKRFDSITLPPAHSLPLPTVLWLCPHQFTETTLPKVTDDLFSPQSNGHIPVLILHDLSGALDTADNPLLRLFHDLVLLLTLPSQSLSFLIYKRLPHRS